MFLCSYSTVQGGRKVPGHSIFNILMLCFFFSDSILYYFRSVLGLFGHPTPKIVQNRIRKKKYSIKILKIECPGTFRPPCRRNSVGSIYYNKANFQQIQAYCLVSIVVQFSHSLNSR